MANFGALVTGCMLWLVEGINSVHTSQWGNASVYARLLEW